jgi:uncharacterized membrane protein
MLAAERSKSAARWLVIVFIVLPIFTIGGCIGLVSWIHRAESQNLRLADGLWAEGKHDEALGYYQKGDYGDLVASHDKLRHATIYQRCIEREILNGNTSSATFLAGRAAKRNLSLTFPDSKNQALFDQALQSVEAEKAAAIREKKERAEEQAKARFAEMDLLELGEFIENRISSKSETTQKIWLVVKSNVYSDPGLAYRTIMQNLRHRVDSETAAALEELAKKIREK